MSKLNQFIRGEVCNIVTCVNLIKPPMERCSRAHGARIRSAHHSSHSEMCVYVCGTKQVMLKICCRVEVLLVHSLIHKHETCVFSLPSLLINESENKKENVLCKLYSPMMYN